MTQMASPFVIIVLIMSIAYDGSKCSSDLQLPGFKGVGSVLFRLEASPEAMSQESDSNSVEGHFPGCIMICSGMSYGVMSNRCSAGDVGFVASCLLSWIGTCILLTTPKYAYNKYYRQS